MADGFLSRWSRRKLETREDAVAGVEPPETEAAVPSVPATPAPEAAAEPAAGTPSAPTLDDVVNLTPEADFTRFMARDVDPGVKNAAMKKLFSDPHYNVMDGLDVYVDDYSKPDPMPESMIRKLATAQFLRLFEAPAEETNPTPSREVAYDPTAQSVAQSEGAPAEETPPPNDADPDLRLQQDDAPPGEDPGSSDR